MSNQNASWNELQARVLAATGGNSFELAKVAVMTPNVGNFDECPFDAAEIARALIPSALDRTGGLLPCPVHIQGSENVVIACRMNGSKLEAIYQDGEDGSYGWLGDGNVAVVTLEGTVPGMVVRRGPKHFDLHPSDVSDELWQLYQTLSVKPS